MHTVRASQSKGLPTVPPAAAGARTAIQHGEVFAWDQTTTVQSTRCRQASLAGPNNNDTEVLGGRKFVFSLGGCHTCQGRGDDV